MWYFVKQGDRVSSVTGEQLPAIAAVDFTVVRDQFPDRNRWDIFVLSLLLHLHHHFQQPVAVNYGVIDRYVVAFWIEGGRALNREFWSWLWSRGRTPLTLSWLGHLWRLIIGFDPFVQVGYAIERLRDDGLLTYTEHGVYEFSDELETMLFYELCQPLLPVPQ